MKIIRATVVVSALALLGGCMAVPVNPAYYAERATVGFVTLRDGSVQSPSSQTFLERHLSVVGPVEVLRNPHFARHRI